MLKNKNGWQYGANTIDKEHIYRILNVEYDDRDEYAAIWAGEYRKPKVGEFYIGGEPAWGFFAFGPIKHDMYNILEKEVHIAKLYKVKKHEYWTLEEAIN